MAELDALLEPLKAEETLEEHGHSMKPDAVRELALLATGDEDLADDLAVKAALREAARVDQQS